MLNIYIYCLRSLHKTVWEIVGEGLALKITVAIKRLLGWTYTVLCFVLFGGTHRYDLLKEAKAGGS